MALEALKIRLGFVSRELEAMVESTDDRNVLKSVHRKIIEGCNQKDIMDIFSKQKIHLK